MLKRTYVTLPYFIPSTGDLIAKWQLETMLKESNTPSDGDWELDSRKPGGVLVISNRYGYWTLSPVNGTELYSVYRH